MMETEMLATGPTIEQLRARLSAHRMYGLLDSPAALRVFTEHHVVCVLDFMSLLKSLQRGLTCVDVPWSPSADPESARLINAIVIDEETDVRADSRVQSHFAWYLEAMDEVGADTAPVRGLVEALGRGDGWERALAQCKMPRASCEFGATTASFLPAPLHVRAAVFFHGREDVIPRMFLPLVEGLRSQGLECESLVGYLTRHIEIDGGTHGPQAEQMLARLYGDDAGRREQAEEAALVSLLARERLWDAVAEALERL
ncbi:DUF3050 domain-containing protein [Engelhardtia mirabilis]